MFSKKNAQVIAPQRQAKVPSALVLSGLLITALAVLPILAVIAIALGAQTNVWPHLIQTVLPRYLSNTLVLMLSVGALSVAMGTGAAWIVTMYRFPGRAALRALLLFPMAIPAYIGAYALVDFLDYSGPVQAGLRALMGWTSARDYWFPETRSIWFAALVLASAFYPYVYLLVRNALQEQSGGLYEVARALGTGPAGLFLRVGLPLSRPALAAGLALVLMETVADFGAVQHFGVQTLTTGIFTTWLDGANAAGAAQIALVLLGMILLLLLAERQGRRNARFFRPARSDRPVVPKPLGGLSAALALGLCAVPVGLGFVLPVAVMAWHALKRPEVWLDPGLAAALGNTVLVGGLAALVTVAAAFLAAYALRRLHRGLVRVLVPVSMLGYAAPGAVLAVGVLIPLAALDHFLADTILLVTGVEPGLLLTGTAFALVVAYSMRFFGIAQSALDAAFGRIPPSLSMAARSLGRSEGEVIAAVHVPLMRGSVVTTLLVVFVECVKELPATLLLRPFNFSTLSTRTYELASLERLGEAAPAALVVILVGMLAVLALLRAEGRARNSGPTP
ncbi:MAG: ABC transporter permease [Paracoccaceae bacterium]